MLKLLRARKFQKKHLKALVDEDTVRAISECCLNVLHGTLKLKKKEKDKLSKYKKEIRYLVKGKDKKVKKKIILQKGGSILPWVLGPALGLLTGLFK